VEINAIVIANVIDELGHCMKRLSTLTLCVFALLIGNPATAAKIFKWVDENGITHFSEHPPKNTASTQIKPKTGHSEPVNYESAKETKAVSENAAARKAEEELARSLKDPTRCAAARKNRETLENFGRVRVKNENDDGFHYLTPDEQQERLRATDKAIEESC